MMNSSALFPGCVFVPGVSSLWICAKQPSHKWNKLSNKSKQTNKQNWLFQSLMHGMKNSITPFAALFNTRSSEFLPCFVRSIWCDVLWFFFSLVSLSFEKIYLHNILIVFTCKSYFMIISTIWVGFTSVIGRVCLKFSSHFVWNKQTNKKLHKLRDRYKIRPPFYCCLWCRFSSFFPSLYEMWPCTKTSGIFFYFLKWDFNHLGFLFLVWVYFRDESLKCGIEMNFACVVKWFVE